MLLVYNQSFLWEDISLDDVLCKKLCFCFFFLNASLSLRTGLYFKINFIRCYVSVGKKNEHLPGKISKLAHFWVSPELKYILKCQKKFPKEGNSLGQLDLAQNLDGEPLLLERSPALPEFLVICVQVWKDTAFETWAWSSQGSHLFCFSLRESLDPWGQAAKTVESGGRWAEICWAVTSSFLPSHAFCSAVSGVQTKRRVKKSRTQKENAWWLAGFYRLLRSNPDFIPTGVTLAETNGATSDLLWWTCPHLAANF